ncbi:Nif3-like dinuclear metal center hexameric protein [Taibaiella sp. KBW10]|uniref:Nif3-like dinuclear metal center hexameric protein n=1 Tax=Taibaiella sp. KBW10 TaxID=2153357 RepID=UPI000F5AA1F2|nr:Nif3-like dinuclear metal center hexameric protein [Taibaiella sp. KBW10]RQO32377.1 Nif3-like dinuclear metal center hexameric protein [Taibaiella sp. KBW10]
MQIKHIIQEIEQFAPLSYQESYDNSGVQVGDINLECSGALLSLDITEAVIEEAIALGCNLIIAHHPLIFSGLKKITGKNMVERCIIKAIHHNITLYAAHTNLDNMQQGVNQKIADKLGLQDTRILRPANNNLYKLYTYVPLHAAEELKTALFAAGAGQIGNYAECSFSTVGTGSFRGNEHSRPKIGTAGGAREELSEVKLEVLVPAHLRYTLINALKAAHPYEEVAYELVAIANQNQTIGSGMIGTLAEPMAGSDFLRHIKQNLSATCIRHTDMIKPMIQKIAVCGGSGSFLLADAMAAGADLFLTADYKYHQFFEAEQQIVIADIGHYESEQFTVEIFDAIINKKFLNFAVHLSKTNTNPINYYF